MTSPSKNVEFEFTPAAYRAYLSRYYTVIDYCAFLDEFEEEMVAIGTSEDDDTIYLNTIHMDADSWDDDVCRAEVPLRKASLPEVIRVLEKYSKS